MTSKTYPWRHMEGLPVYEHDTGVPAIDVHPSEEDYARLCRLRAQEPSHPRTGTRALLSELTDLVLRASPLPTWSWSAYSSDNLQELPQYARSWYPWPLVVLVARRPFLDGPGEPVGYIIPRWSLIAETMGVLQPSARAASARALDRQPLGFFEDVLAVMDIGGRDAAHALLRTVVSKGAP